MVEAELRAQIDRALATGLRIDYLDYHMRVAISTPELRAIVERLAEDYGLGLAQYLGETSTSIWDVAPEKKLPRLLELVDQAEPGETMNGTAARSIPWARACLTTSTTLAMSSSE